LELVFVKSRRREAVFFEFVFVAFKRKEAETLLPHFKN